MNDLPGELYLVEKYRIVHINFSCQITGKLIGFVIFVKLCSSHFVHEVRKTEFSYNTLCKIVKKGTSSHVYELLRLTKAMKYIDTRFLPIV